MAYRATRGRGALLATFAFFAFLSPDPLIAGPVLSLSETREWAAASLWSPSPPSTAALGFLPARVGDALGPAPVPKPYAFAPSLAVDVLQASNLVQNALPDG